MKNDKQKKKKINKSKKQNKYRALSLVLTSSLVIAPLTAPLSFYLPGGITASAAILDAEILSNITSSNNSGTTTANRWAADGSSQNVDFTISGSELIGGSVITSGTKQAVLAIPNELNGRVSPNGAAQIDTNVTLTVSDLTFLTGTLNAVNDLSTLLTNIVGGSLGSLTGVNLNLTTVNQKIDALNNLQNFGSAQFTSTATLSADGSYIQANIDDGLGLVLAQNVSSLLQDLKAAVDALQASGTSLPTNIIAGTINAALLPVKGAVDTAINLALPLVGLGGAGVNQLADASVLGSTTVTIPTTVVSPTSLSQNLDAKFVGTVVKADVIDVGLINTANGVSNIYYSGTAVVVAPPVVTGTSGNSTTGYTVTGTATAGNTVEIRNASGTVLGTAVADGSGNFTITIPQGQATASESLNAVAKSGANESIPTPFTTPADAAVIAPPVVTNTTGTSTTGYTVTGTATAGNTVEIRNSGGTVIGTGVADGSGNFTITIPQGQATASESLNAVAKSGANESIPTPFTTPADAAVIAPPVVTNTTGTSTTGYTVTGTATAGNTVEIRNSGGTVIGTGVADGSGNFTITIPQGQATASESLNAVATDGTSESTPTPFTTPADPVVVTAPTVDSVTGNSSTGYTVTGTATPGDVVTIKNSGGTVVGTATADPSGNYTVVIPVGSATPNEQLTATATDGAGNTSAGTSFTTPADPVVVPAPTVTGVTGTSATGYTVTGTATPGDTVSIKNTGGTVIGTAVADAGGNYTVTIPAGLATPVEQLKAVATDPSGNQSTATPFTTPADPVVVTAPTVDSVTGNSSTGYTVTGTAPAGDVVTIKNSGGTVVGTATADPSGNYTVVIPVGSATPNEQLTATATDGAGNTSAGTPFTTPADPVVVPAPTVTGVTGTSATGYTVTGTATPGDTVSIKNTGGTVIGTAVADAGGNYTVTIPAGLATPVEQLKAVATDPSGNQSTATPFTTPADPVIVTAPTVDSVTGNSSTGYTVTGTAPAGDVVTIKNSGGTVVGTATADPSGNYTVVIPVGSATPNEQLTATATDGAGNTSAGTPFTTPADPVVVPAPTVTGVTGTSATGYTVTGTATPGDTVSIKNTGGTVIGTAVADAGGNYTVTIPAGLATPVEQLKAVATDPSGNQSTATPFTTPADPVIVTAPTVDSVTGNSSTGYTVTGTAPAGDVVTIKNSGGTVVGTATADPSGNYTVVIPVGSATPNEQLTATATDGAGNTSAGTPFTTPADPVVVPAPTVTGVTGNSATGYTVTGTATPGDTVSIKNTGGTVIGTAVADAGGNYTVTIPAGLATPVEQLKAVATDPSGNQSTATPFTTPADPVVVTAPTVDSVTGNSSTGYTVTGTAPAGDVVTIKNSGGTVVGTATADPSGNYTVVIPVGSATPNEQLTATATDGAGNTSAGTPFTTPADPVVVPAPTVTGVTGTSATGYTVTGTATPGDTVSIKNTGGTVIGTAVADAGGNYTVTIPAGLATPVEQLKAVATDPSGNQSTATPFTTPADPVVVTAPTVDSVTGNSSTGYTVTGTAPAGDVVTIKNSGGTVVGTATADPSGNYTVVIPVGSATPNEQLTATATDGAGNTSAGTPFTTPADPVVVPAPTVTGVTGNSATGYTVTGTATPGDTVSIKNTGGTVIGTAVADAGGNYTVTIPAGLATPVEQLKAVATDPSGNQSTATPFTTPADPVVVTAPTVDSVTGNSSTGYTVTGTAPAGDVVTIKNSGGTVVGTATADPSGNYTVVIPVGSATPNEQLTATATDGAGNTSAGTPFTTPADPVVVPAPTVTGVTGTSATGYTVTGTATPGDTVSIKNTGGTVIGTAVADAGGNYTVTIPAGLATPVEQLKAVATDPSGNQSTATPFTTPADPVIVTAPTVDSVTGNSSTGYTVTGTAPAGDVVTIKNSGGTVVGTATADPSGNYTVVIPVGSATPNEQLTATATDGAGNTSAGTPFTTPADPVVVPAPTVTGVTGNSATGYTVTGTATPGDTVSIKNTGGTVIGTAVADAGGNYTVTIPAGLATPVEQLKAVATDPSGNQSTATPFTTPADPVVVTAPTVDSVTGNSSTGYTVTGTAPAGDVVTIKNSGGTVVGTATADPSGNYTVVIPVGSATPNEQLTATATDGAGNTSAGTPFTTPADPVVVPAPTVTGVTGTSATGYTVTGTATPGDTVSIKNTGGTVIGTAVADAGGNYTVTIPAGLATPVEQLKAVATDPSGNQSTATPFTTPADPVVVTAPTVDSVTGNSSTGYTVTGTAPAGDVVTIKNSGGTVVGTATADPSGNYTVVIPVGSATPNEQLTATATDGAGNTSAGTPFTTPADPVVVPAPTVTGVTGNSATGYTVTGTATPGDTVSIKNTGGTVIGTAVADAGGNYTVTIPAGLATPVEQLKAVATDPSGNQSTATPFTTPADPVVVTAPTVDSVTGNSSTGYTVTGTAPAGDVVTIKNSGGTVVGTATADPSGNYTVVIPVGSATPNEQLTATATDGAGNTSAGTPFTTPADPVVVPAPTVTGVTGTSATGYTVTGTATPGDTVSIKNTGGTVIGTAVADAGGNYTVTIPAGLATPVEQLKAVATDPSGNQSTATPFTTPADPVVVTAPTVDSVTGNSSSGYVVNGKATAGNTVEIRNTSGTVIGTVVADASGNYMVSIPVGSATQKEQLKAIAKDGAGNTSTATLFMTPADPAVIVATPTISKVTGSSLTGYTIIGKATPGNKVEIRNSDNELLGQAIAAADGGFTITLPIGLAVPNEQLTAIAKDSNNNQSAPAVFNLPNDPNTRSVKPPTVNSVTGSSTTGYTVNGTADPDYVINIYNPSGVMVATGEVDDSGNYSVKIPAGMAMPNEKDTAVAFDANGNRSIPTEFVIPADSGSNNGGNGSNGLLTNNGKSSSLGGTQKNLPNNGEIVSNWALLGSFLLAGLGLFSLKRRNKKEEE